MTKNFNDKRTLSLAFAEKKTGLPIQGLKIRILKNGKESNTSRTDSSGALAPLFGYKLNDEVEVFVEKIGGGFKFLKKVLISNADLSLVMFSPKTKIASVTEPHRGAPGSTGTMNAGRNNDLKQNGFDSLDALEAFRNPTTGPGGTIEVVKVRSISGSPKAIAVKRQDCPPALEIHASAFQRTLSGMLFPLPQRPSESYKSGARRFGSKRARGRRHAGIDLYAPVGTPVRALADGKVLQVYLFYLGTMAIEVDHGSFIARYGELQGGSVQVRIDSRIDRGQKLGEVGKLKGLDFSMLHLEFYGTAESPSLEGRGLTQKSNPPFQRRNDLIDPTPSIDLASME